jgi:outer membrane receptor protein involved in Fe transport
MPVRHSSSAVRNSFPLPLKRLRRNHSMEATRTSLRPLGSAVLLLLLLLALAFGGAPQGHAQAVWGSITGYVTDASGAAVPQATVTVTAEDTGIETKVDADSAGFYNATHLNPGQYSVAVRMPGFSGFVREHVLLQVGSSVRVDCPLKVGSASETVMVTAAPPILNTEKTDVNARFDAQTVDSFPVSGNNVTQLYSLVPGVLSDTFQMGTGENPQGTNRTYVNGVWSGAQVYVLDGISDVDYGFSGIQVINPPPDSVQELKVITADYDPEFGNTAGMVAQFVTKSGSNQFHGSVYEYNQNYATFASTPFTGGLPAQPYNWNQAGFSLGGPIKKDKIFFFGDYQLTRLNATNSVVATVPTAAFRNGDFSAQANTAPIYDPETGNPDGTGRTMFPNNVIPAARISPVAQNLVNLLPLPNLNQNTDLNFLGEEPQTFNTSEYDARIDWSISDKDKFFGRYSLFDTYLDNPGAFGIAAGGPAAGGLSPEIANTRSQQAALNYTHTFGTNLLGEFRAGFNRFAIDALQADSALETNTQVGIPGINISGNPQTGGLAGINVSGPVGIFTMGIPSGVGIPRFEGSTTFEIVNNWTKIFGPHQILFGADLQRQDFNFLSVNASTRGNFTFNPSVTATPTVATSGLGVASFMLGLPSEFDRAIFTQFPGERQSRIGLYAQDVWRVNPKLTVNVGIRWDYFEPVKPAHAGGLANFDPATGYILLAGLGNVSSSADVHTPYNDFSPRVGFAYKLAQNTVIRAGLGKSFFSSGYDATFYHLTSFYPITAQQTIQASNIYQYIFPIADVPAAAPAPPLPSSGRLLPPDGTLLKTRNLNFLTENMYSWNLTVETQLDARTTMTVGYVGTKGTHMSFGQNINAAGPGVGPLINRRPYYNLYGLSQPIDLQGNMVNANYNGLVVGVKRRFTKYLAFTGNYTWSKTLGYYQYNPIDLKSDYGVGGNTNAYFEGDSGINRTNVFTLGYTALVPYGRDMLFGSNSSALVNALLGGWQTSGVWAVESGLPFSPFVSSNTSLNADYGQIANRVPNQPLYPANKSFSNWFNQPAFAIPTCCQYGNAQPGLLTGPNVFKADLAVWKGWKFPNRFSEQMALQLRVEAFNAFNHVNAGIPDNNIDDPAAGQITSLQSGLPMRQFQLGLHLQF